MTDISHDGWDYLQRLRDRYADRPEQDRPDWVSYAIEDGTVQTRPLTFDDIVAWCERKLVGEVE